jgi:hypothetical protein
MSGIRAGIAAFVVSLAIAPATAWGFAPGDPVGFAIPDSELGDTFTVSVERLQVGSGIDDTEEPGVGGSFAMPDLGSKARSVNVLIALTRAADGTSRSYESSVDYSPAAAPQPQPSPSPAPGHAQPPSSPSVLAPQPALPGSPGGRADESPGAGGDGSSLLTDVAKDTISVLGGAIGQAIKPGTRRSRGAARRHHKRHRKGHHRKRKVNRIKPTRDPPAVRGRDVEPPRDTRRDLSGDDFPGLGYTVAWKLLIGVALAGLMLALLVAARARSRRRRREQEEAAMEAELQQLLHELTSRQAAAIEYLPD